MTNLESRLREVLAEVETGPVNPSALARGARRSAARTRRRVVLGSASAVAVAVTVAVVGAIDLGREQTLVPATSTPVQSTVTAGELCSRAAQDITAEALVPAPLSEGYSALALCPADPSASPWSSLTMPSLVTGRAMDVVVLGHGGPPSEQCGHDLDFPDLRFVLQSVTGQVVGLQGDELRCDGRYSVQSFYAARAESDLAASGGRTVGGAACAPVYPRYPPPGPGGAETTEPIRSVVVCVHPPSREVIVDAVPRFTPVIGFTAPGDGSTIVQGWRSGRVTSGPLEECPWLGAVVVLQAEGPNAQAFQQQLRCEPPDVSGDARWLSLSPAAEEVIRSFLDEAQPPS